MEKNILFLSFWTPPVVRPRAIAAGKIIPEMMRRDVKPVVVTYDCCGPWDISLPLYTVPVFDLGREDRLIFKIPFFKSLNTLWQEHVYLEKLYQTIADIIKQHNIEVIFSFSNPQTSNLVGAMLRKRLHMPFVSHFSDPWYDNPYRQPSILQAAKIYLQERYVIRNSNKIVFTNDQALALVMKKYPKYLKKALVVPHCFNYEDYPEVEKKNPADKFIITHTGVFYKKRNPEALFQAINRLFKQNPDLADKLSVRLIGATEAYGTNGGDLSSMIKEYKLENIVDILPRVDYRESLRQMKLANCLVVIDAPADSSPFLPSKIVDYVGSDTCIIGITPHGSPTAEFLTQANYKSFAHDEVDELAAHLSELISNSSQIETNHSFVGNYTVKSVVTKLLYHLKEASYGNKP